MQLESGAQSVGFRLVATPLAALFQMIAKARNAAFDRGLLQSHSLPGKVISVGNIAVGGTGKSPVVMAIAAELRRRGYEPAILTRGYGSGLAKDDSLVLLGSSILLPPRGEVRLPDEGRMQAEVLRNVPVIVGAARFQAAQRYLAAHPGPTHWILDDGFQHRRLRRDLDIVLLDAERPWGNDQVLPRGNLREAAAALKRAHVVIFTRANSSGRIAKPSAHDIQRVRDLGVTTVLQVAFVAGAPQSILPAAEAFDPTRHAPLLLVTGIAQPAVLREELESRGLALSEVLAVRDHGSLSRAEILRGLIKAASVLTTAKDYWRDPAVFADLPRPVFIQPLAAELSKADFAALFERMAT